MQLSPIKAKRLEYAKISDADFFTMRRFCGLLSLFFSLGSVFVRSYSSRQYAVNEINTLSTAIARFVENPNNGLILDMITASALGTMSDAIAQVTSHDFENDKSNPNILTSFLTKWKYDWDRTSRFAVFGFFDGAVGHGWFYAIEYFIKDSKVIDIITKVAADTTIYTPLWCVWFLFAMTFLEKGNLKGIFDIIRREWISLLKLSTSFYFPISCVLYSLIPVQKRVLASALGTMICTVALSLWNAARNKKDKSQSTKDYQYRLPDGTESSKEEDSLSSSAAEAR